MDGELIVGPSLALRPLTPADQGSLGRLFSVLVANGDSRFFEPHPMTDDEAARLVQYSGRDVFVIAEQAGTLLGYGLLRGWDEGFTIPSLGVAIHPEARGSGLGRLLMHYLHTIARRRGADRVRLRVHVENTAAIALYQSLGYEFGGRSGNNLVAFCTLGRSASAVGP